MEVFLTNKMSAGKCRARVDGVLHEEQLKNFANPSLLDLEMLDPALACFVNYKRLPIIIKTN